METCARCVPYVARPFCALSSKASSGRQNKRTAFYEESDDIFDDELDGDSRCFSHQGIFPPGSCLRVSTDVIRKLCWCNINDHALNCL